MILHKEMKKLYLNKYQYKAVLVLDAAWLFRGKNLEIAKEKVISFELGPFEYRKIADKNMVLDLIQHLTEIEDFTVRVERCYLSLYFTHLNDLTTIQNKFSTYVKEVYTPKLPLIENTIVSSLPYEYKVHINVNRNIDYSGFINWATDNKNIRIPKSTVKSLSRMYLFSPSVYFYINGDKQLTLARMHLGSGINRIEKIINP